MTLSPAPQASGTTVWTLDPSHTLVEFAAKHMMLTTVKGRFRHVEGTIRLDAANPSRSSVEVTIDAGSLASDQDQRDQHLKSPDFLHVEQHPTITFKSTRVEPVDATHLRVVGDLAIRGVARKVVLDTELNGIAKDPAGMTVASFSATTGINRKDFGLIWNYALETGGWLVGDIIKIAIDVEAFKQD